MNESSKPKKQILTENLVFLLLGGLYCWSLSCAVSGFSFSLIRPEILLGLSFAAVLAFIIMLSARITLVLGVLGMATGIIAYSSDISRAVSLLIQGEALEWRHQFILMAVIVTILALFINISFKLSVNYFLLAIVGAVLYCLAFKEGSVNGGAFYAFLLVMLILFLTRVYSNRVRNSETFLGRYMLSALPLAAAAVIVAAIAAIPFSSTPGTSPLFPYESFKDFVQRGLLGGFSESISFERDEYMLGGVFDMDSQPLLLVNGPSHTDLYGGISDVYTGYSWIKSNTQKSEFLTEYHTVDMATLKSIQASDFDAESISVNTISIKYLLESDILFTPRLADMFDRLGNRQVYLNQMGEFSASQPVKSGGTIEITYYQESIKDIYGIANLSSALKRYDVEQIAVESVFDHRTLTYYQTWDQSDLNDYIESIQKQYTQLSDSVTGRTAELAKSLTDGLDDVSAKAEAICNYLVQTYTYSLTPTDPPDGTDFVDYFLFEEKQGYSNSFASAMVVLCRTLDIPARFVSGYHLPAASDEDGNHIVRTRSRHAWAEVYLEGYGWCVFEAAPPYAYLTADSNLKPSIKIDPDGGEDMETHLADLGLMFSEQDAVPQEQEISIQDQIISEEEQSQMAQEEAVKQEKTKSHTAIFVSLGFFIAAMLLCLVRYRTRISKQNKALRGTPEQLAEFSFRHIVRLAEFADCRLSASQTPIEIMRQLAERYSMLGEHFKAAGEVYSTLAYSKNPVSDNQAMQLYKTYLAFDMYIKEDQNNLRYMVAKYFIQNI